MLNKKIFYGGVYGFAVGDALGVPVEFVNRDILNIAPVNTMRGYGTHNQPAGTWSDDTSMMLATLDVMSRGGLSTGMVMEAFKLWLTEAKYTANNKVFDVGNTTYSAIKNYISGEDPEDCGELDEFSNGNGSLMRMLPMVYYTYLKHGIKITPLSVDTIYRLSSLTHAHIISKVCCVYYVYIGIYIMEYGCHYGLQRSIKDAIGEVEHYYYAEQGEISCVLNATGMKSLSESVDLSRDNIKSTGYVVDSLQASIWCLFNTNSYREAIELAVNLGGDTDTIGAITGSLAGIYYGADNIPVDWIDSMQNFIEITKICDKFYNQYK